MCGRYYLNGEICPSQEAVVLTGKGIHLKEEIMQWGFPKYDLKGLIINARVETVKEKRIFQDSILNRRCVIPAEHYFEWDVDRNKVTFLVPKKADLYMAGFYRQNRFVILTTEANESVRKVHNRMPLILNENELEDWVYNDEMLDYFLQKTPPMLEKYQEYEQQTFDFI